MRAETGVKVEERKEMREGESIDSKIIYRQSKEMIISRVREVNEREQVK